MFLQVKIWFQNRRTKWKKQDNISNAEAAEHKNQTSGKQIAGKPGGKSPTNGKTITSEGAINLVKGEPGKMTLGDSVKIKDLNGDNGVNLMKHVTETVANLTKRNESVKKTEMDLIKSSLDVIKIPSTDSSSLVNSLFKTVDTTSPNSQEDHSNTSIFTQNGSVSEGCYSESASTEMRLPIVGLVVGLTEGSSKSVSRSPPCDINSQQSELSPADDHLVIAENENCSNS